MHIVVCIKHGSRQRANPRAPGHQHDHAPGCAHDHQSVRYVCPGTSAAPARRAWRRGHRAHHGAANGRWVIAQSDDTGGRPRRAADRPVFRRLGYLGHQLTRWPRPFAISAKCLAHRKSFLPASKPSMATRPQVGPGIAKRLGLNQLTYVASIDTLNLAGGSIDVSRRAEGGLQKLHTKLPALITMLEGTVDIRRGTVTDALRAARAEIVTWNAEQAGITELGKCRPTRIAHGRETRVRAKSACRKSRATRNGHRLSGRGGSRHGADFRETSITGG